MILSAVNERDRRVGARLIYTYTHVCPRKAQASLVHELEGVEVRSAAQ